MFIKTWRDIFEKQLLVGMVGATLLLGACGNGSTGNNSAEKKMLRLEKFLIKEKSFI